MCCIAVFNWSLSRYMTKYGSNSRYWYTSGGGDDERGDDGGAKNTIETQIKI